jgi:uncharacterized membrane protein SpoIIM required for sporulation
MKETTFIQQNKKKWARFEKLSGNKNNDPDEVSELFTEITEDLSYARTFYPRRSVRVYLNQLAQGVFTSLYKQRKQPLGSFVKYWTEVVPLEMYRARIHLLTAFLFFMVAVGIGMISQEYDHSFIRVILGDGYVDATEERIANNDPMGVYGDSASSGMFWEITIHNIQVAFMAFASGILFTLGTYWVLIQNGIMLGAFQWWFKAKGLLLTTFLTIWIHGAFEISAIVISGAAGITVGSGLIFPRSFSRVQSLVFSARRGLMIMLSLIPFFIAAGFLESYVTRHYQTLHDAFKLLIIFGSFAIIILYYVIYPFIVAKKFPEKIEIREVPRFIPERKIEWFKIRNIGEVFTDTFYLFINKISKLSRIFFSLIFPLSLILIGVIYSIDAHRFAYYDLDWHQNLGSMAGTGNDFAWHKLLGWSFLLCMLIQSVSFVMQDDDSDESLIPAYLRYFFRSFIWVYLYALLIFSILIFSNGVILFLVIFVSPFLLMIPSIINIERTNFFNAFGRCFSLGGGAYGDGLGAFFMFGLITVIFFLFLHNPFEFGLTMIIDSIVRDLTITVTPHYNAIIAAVNAIIYVLFLFGMFTINCLAFGLCYYSSAEKKTATSLNARLVNFGKRNKTVENALDFE